MSDQPSTPVVEHPQKGSTHYQDPSPLVIQMVQREIAQLQELRISELEGLRREIITRLDAMDKALRKVEEYPTDVDRAVARLREYVDERFGGVEVRFAERDKRFTQRDEASRELLQEQRASSATAISKSEATTRQQLDTLTVALRDLKERLDTTEGKTAGVGMLWGIIVAAIMAAGALVTTGAVLMTRVPAA